MLLTKQQELVLCMLIGDGYISKEGRFTMEHSIKQDTYLFWKKQLLEHEFFVNLKPYFRAGRNTRSIYLDRKEIFLPLRNKVYKEKKKISEILKLISNKDLALAFWLFDDAATNKASIKLCICDSDENEQKYIIDWFKKNYKVHCYIRYEKHNIKNYPFLIFNELESMVLLTYVKKYITGNDFLEYKFRKLLNVYNLKYNNIEYNLPTSPRIPKITSRETLNYSDAKVISYYNFCNSIKKTAKYFNCVERIIIKILDDNNKKHPRGYKGNIR